MVVVTKRSKRLRHSSTPHLKDKHLKHHAMKNIEENNRLIALFMAAGTPEEAVLKHDLQKAGTVESMQYHEDWNWLMEVVEKINSFNEPDNEDAFTYNVIIRADRCQIVTCEDSVLGYSVIVDNDNGTSLIEMAYQTIVEFIKWHNENNQA